MPFATSTGTERSTTESGISRVIQNQELEEQRRDDLSLYGIYEARLFEIFKIVWNAHNPNRKISENAELQVDFYDPKPAISPKDQAETWDRLLALGVISEVDIAMSRNPDFQDRESAMAFLMKVKEETKALNE